jgi:hypothetical protein
MVRSSSGTKDPTDDAALPSASGPKAKSNTALKRTAK